MKQTLFLKLALLGLMAVVATTGCKKTPKNVTPINGIRTAVGPGTGEIPGPGGLDGAGRLPGPGTGIGSLDNGVGTRPIGQDLTPRPPVTPDFPAISANPDEFYKDMLADRTAFAGNTVYFDYDKAVVKASEVSKLNAIIATLKASPRNKLLVEGHCDERGTEEYNRALSDRRALAIRDRLTKAGLAPDRIMTLPLGEDKPAALGHTDADWAKNRRGEIVLLKPKN